MSDTIELLNSSRFRITIKNGDTYMEPLVRGKITVEWDRGWNPGKLTMDLVITDELEIEQGNSVRLVVDDDNDNAFFYGYIFKFSEKKDGILTCTCFDQLRYLKNKDTYTYQNMTYSNLLKMICKSRNLEIGTVEDTKYQIEGRIEENKEYYEILKNASDLTTTYTDNIFELYDQSGKLCLKNIQGMKVDSMVLDRDVFQDYDYESSINDGTYNRVKIDKINHDTNSVVPVILEDKKNIAKWGVLQYYAPTTEEDISAKMKGILELSNKEMRKFSAKGVIGNKEVRAGSLIPVFFKFYDLEVNGYMLVDSVKHEFEKNHHFMELTLFNKDIKPVANLDGMFKNEKKEKDAEGGSASGGSSGGFMSGNTTEEKVWSSLRASGYSEASTAGAMGNIKQESNFNYTVVNHIGAFGLCQWLGGRRKSLQAFAKKRGKTEKDLESQILFLIEELGGSQWMTSKSGMSHASFKSSTNVKACTEAFCWSFERPGRHEANIPRRVTAANTYYNQFKGKAIGGGAGTGGIGGKRDAFVRAAIAKNGAKYSQPKRMQSGYYDCSSLIIRSMREVGLDSTGGNMTTRTIAGDSRFVSISKSQLVKGDILWHSGHVAIFMGGNQTFEAMNPRQGVGYSVMGNRFNRFYRIKGIG